MNVKSIVVEQLDWNGMSKSLTIEPDHNGQLWVAFPTDYEEPRNGPFYFQNSDYEKKFDDRFAQCKARKVTSNNFFQTKEVYTFKTNWQKIPTDKMSVSYYALYLPEYAVPLTINIFDSFNKEKQFKRTVFKDQQQPRYIIYLQCASRFGEFSFDIECEFKKDKNGFVNSLYTDNFQQDFYAQPDDWKYFVNEIDREKTQQFFTGDFIFNTKNITQKIEMKKNNPWVSGLFYLFVGVIVITGLAVLSNTVHWTAFPIIIIGSVLLIGIIGALQLKNDDKLNEKNFITLMKEVYGSLPLLKMFNRKDKEDK